MEKKRWENGKEIGNNCKRGGCLSADPYRAQAKDALTHCKLGQPAGKAAVGTVSGRRGNKSAELPSYIQPSENVLYGDICTTVQLCFTKESLIQRVTYEFRHLAGL